MSGAPAGPARRPGASRGPSAAAYVLLALWLEAGYAAAIFLLGGAAVGASLWQAGICLLAAIPLLYLVIQLVALPKRLERVSWPAIAGFWTLGNLAELALPWLGWTLLLVVLNRGLGWSGAMRAGAGVAAFSYLTGAWLLVRLRPGPGDVEVTRLEVPVADLPEAFDGYRILHISDAHVGPLLSAEGLRDRLAAAGDLDPDTVVFTGDLAEAGGREAAAAAILSGLRARDGMLAVLGNHDMWLGEKRVRAALSSHGIRVLVNENTVVRRGASRLFVAGVGDSAYTARDDLAAALADIPEEEPVILLSHSPRIVRKPAARRAALVLSGHTHGGQVVFPVIGALHVPSGLGRRLASGLHRVGGQWVFISRGLGEIFPPLRIACSPEIALLTLRRGRVGDAPPGLAT